MVGGGGVCEVLYLCWRSSGMLARSMVFYSLSVVVGLAVGDSVEVRCLARDGVHQQAAADVWD